MVTAVATRGRAAFLDHLMAAWPQLTGESPSAAYRLMKASSRLGPRHPLLFFLFRPGAGEPSYVLKLGRDPAYPDAIEREFRNYSAIYARGGATDRAMPRPIFCAPVGDYVTLCETFVRGRRCEDRHFAVQRGGAHRGAVERFLTGAAGWAREFHARTSHGAAALDRASALRAFALRPDVARPTADGLTALAARLDAIPAVRWPRSAVHGDFDHGNILLDGAQLGVVDWEECEPMGDPLVDLAYLVLHLALVAELGGTVSARLGRFFRPGSWTDGLTRAVLDDYGRAHGLSAGLILAALPSVIIEVLTRDHPSQRDPRTIPLYSLDVLAFTVERALREAAALA